MTGDSKLFPPLPQWEKKGYQPDEYGHWLKGGWQPFDGDPSILRRAPGHILSRDGRQVIQVDDVADIALPLYEGRMVGQFDFSQKGWVSGKGRTAVWREIPWEEKVIEPQYLMARTTLRETVGISSSKIALLSISSSTNSRSMISTVLSSVGCGHSLGVLNPNISDIASPQFAACLNSFVFDFALRCRLGGLNLSWFILEETPVLTFRAAGNETSLNRWASQLIWPHQRYAAMWENLRPLLHSSGSPILHWKQQWALTTFERLRLTCQIDAVMAWQFGLSAEDVDWALHDCDHSAQQIGEKAFIRTLNPKGFWRVDKDKNPELRHTVLAQVAFQDLQEKGLDAFLAQNDGEGWMIPETLRLADYGLGHDDRAKVHQPVAARLGPRFHDWQLTGTPEESWAECERHAENLRLLLGEAEPVRVLGEEKGEYGVEREPRQLSWLDG